MPRCQHQSTCPNGGSDQRCQNRNHNWHCEPCRMGIRAAGGPQRNPDGINGAYAGSDVWGNRYYYTNQ